MTPVILAVKLPGEIGEREYIRLYEKLPPKRRERVAGMKKKQMAYGALFSYALLRYGIFREYSIPDMPEIAYGEFGKPHFPSINDIYFSLSDTKTHAMCAIHNFHIGADVEQIRPIRAPLMRTTLTEAEKEFVGVAENTWRFFKIWTLKEAYLKLTGTGLTVPLKSVEFTIDKDITIDKPGVFPASYELDGCMAAVCAKTPPPDKIEIIKYEELIK